MIQLKIANIEINFFPESNRIAEWVRHKWWCLIPIFLVLLCSCAVLPSISVDEVTKWGERLGWLNLDGIRTLEAETQSVINGQ